MDSNSSTFRSPIQVLAPPSPIKHRDLRRCAVSDAANSEEILKLGKDCASAFCRALFKGGDRFEVNIP